MAEINYLCPLKIPRGYPLIAQRRRRFDNGFPQDMTLEQALGYLNEELKQFKAERINVYSNFDRLAVPSLRRKVDDDSAICLEIGVGSRQYHLVSDCWSMAEHNIYALHLAVRAVRNMEKWGIGDVQTILYGFEVNAPAIAKNAAAELDENASASVVETDWMRELGLGAYCTLEDANAIYRHRAKQAMRDEVRMLQLNQAIEAARKYFAQ